MPIDPEAVIANLHELHKLTGDEHGAQRLAWSPTWLRARKWFVAKLQDLPVEHHLDAAGNRWVTLRGKSKEAFVIGSHLDSVPNGGWLDGCLGVLAGFDILRAIAEEFDGEPPCTLRLVDWADEEGARFGRSLFGSSAFAGKATIEADRARLDCDGNCLEEVLRSCEIEISRIGEAMREQLDIAAYIELHIEQGPVLEQLSQPLAAVLGTKGVERHTVTFTGQEAHSGSTPMAARRDALAAAAQFALAIREIATKYPGAVGTVGSLKTYPGIATAVVGRCELTLDQRDLDADVLAAMFDEAQDAGRRIAEAEGCTVAWSNILSIEPIPFHPELIELCDRSIVAVAGRSHRMPSGPLHDAAEVARLGVPTAMMFVQSLGGISHNKIEDTRIEHLHQAIRAFYLLATQTMNWIDSRQSNR